jgi:alpha-N-arabinofuranosidase
MQFMEPLGTTDGSIEAGWDFVRSRWRRDLIEVTRELAPTLIRWGGMFSSYYRWREGIGPRNRRIPMHNLTWGGMETNQVGTHEFVDFCKQVGADPLIAVNFLSEGLKRRVRPRMGGIRAGGAKEAAEWVDYCNNPRNVERRRNGAKEPFRVRLWQIGNETSYGGEGFNTETAAKQTLSFARAMRKADPDIKLIAWGDSGWARRMIDVTGGEIDYIAFHHHFDSGLLNTPLRGTEYRNDPDRTWRHFMNAYKSTETRIREMRREIAGYGLPLAMTESHFALKGTNRGHALSTWAAGVANARILNVHARNGDILKIATLADFCGTRWQVNAIMMPTPMGGNRAYMMPVARVMSLFRRHGGKKAVGVVSAPEGLDVTASRSGGRVFLHVVNVSRAESVRARLEVEGMRIVSGRVFEISDDPTREIDESAPGIFAPVERVLPQNGNWRFPPASVSAVELVVEPVA